MATTSTGPIISDVTAADFDQAVLERSRRTPVLVDFWAAWCGPCRALTPQIEKVVRARAGAVALAKVNVDAEQQLAQRFRISGIPHVKLFRDGREADSFVGARSATAIDAFLDEHLAAGEFEQLLDRHRQSGRYVEAVAAFDLGYVGQAFEHLLREVKRTDGDERDEARAFMVAAFQHVGSDHPAVQRYRRQLASTLD